MNQTFRAFAHRNYRIYWTGFALSLVGTWMQTLAQGWLVWRLTESSMWLGIIGAMPQLPSLLLGSVGGVLIDRTVKRTVLIVTQTGMAISALILAALTISGTVTVAQVLVLSAVSGIFMAVDAPARLAFVSEIVGKDDLGNAIALNASTFNATRLIGPAFAGFLVPVIGEGGCFLINGISYLSLILALLAMKSLPQPVAVVHEPVLKQMREAYQFVIQSPVHRTLILNVMVFAGFGLSYPVLMPVFADEVLRVGVRGLGALMGATGVGALIGGIWQASFPRGAKRGRVVILGATGMGVSLGLFSLSNHFIPSLLALGLTGFSGIAMLASTNTLLQSLAPDHLRGRVMGIYTSSFLGLLPVGSLIVGTLASRLSPQISMGMAAVVCLLVTALTLLRNERLKAV